MSSLNLHLLSLCAVFVTYIPRCQARVEFHNDDLKAYDKFPNRIHDYDIIIPTILHHNRYKRDSQSSFSTKLKFEAFGEDLHLNLFPSERFFRPDLEVTHINPDNTVVKKPLGVSRDCFYHGFSPSHNYSRAVITMCDDDVYGYIDQGEDGIFITPLNEKHTHEYSRRKRSTGRPHLIYKRTVDNGDFCPVKYEGELDPIHSGQGGSFAKQASENYTPPKYLEVLVILDVDFVNNRGPDYSTYAMALMHVVSRRYAEPSLDVSMNIYVVEVIDLSTDSATVYGNSLSVSANGATTLDNLRSWNAASFIPNGNTGHWDNAVIISGKDLLTSSGGSGLLGIASILGTCVIGEGSNVNEDTGLAAGLTIAHEIGHTFTLLHDEDVGCNDPSGFVMSTFASATPNSFFWSGCSSSNLKIFFRSPASNCMDNKPDGLDALQALVLPGQMYDLDEQCNQANFAGSCQEFEVNCQFLQCMSGGNCVQSFRTTAEGTPCGDGMLCLGTECVPSNSVPQPMNGGWSDWTEWPCSRTCGCGVLLRQRLCNNPSPQWGGAHCDGEGTENTLCNCDSCGNTPDDHRNEQCAASNNVPLNGVFHSWVAFFGNFISEIFYCQNPCQTNLPDAYLRPPFENVDGTDCWDHEVSDWFTLQKCVTGICQEFGCDGVQGGTKTFDECRICNGDGSTCMATSGSYPSGSVSVFNDIVIIPEGSTSVIITNNDLVNGNHIAISGLTSTADYFRGSGSATSTFIRVWYLTMTIIHDFDGNAETFFTQGPTIEPLSIQIYLTTQITNSVSYEYYLPNAGTSYFWNVCDFDTCSVTCGDGMQTREITCDQVVGSTQTVVDDSFCDSNVGVKPDETQPCNLGQCPSWVEGEFGPCNVECGMGVQTRTVDCQLDGEVVDETMCTDEKPTTEEMCDQGTCVWITGSFDECSFSCGGGTQTRTVDCINMGGSGDVVADVNCVETKPDTTQNCNIQECPAWVVSDFGECSKSCDTGMQSRDVECQYEGSMVADDLCEEEKPESTQSCNQISCDGDMCCESIRDASGTVERTSDTQGRTCTVTLIAPLGKTFELDNLDVDISCGSESFTLIDGVNRYRRCGGGGNALATANLEGNIIFIEFQLTGSGSFKFDFSSTSAGIRSRSCDQFIDTFSDAEQGRLRTPRFPKSYPPRSRCTMQIVAEKEKKLFLRFSRFQLQASMRRNCRYDRLELTNLLTGSQEVFCGNLGTFTRTLDNYVQLYFKSNNRRNFRGFQVRYRVM